MNLIEKFKIINVEKYKLYIALLRDDYKYSFVGILKDKNVIIDYCEIEDLFEYKTVCMLYDIFTNNEVLPSHFTEIMDDFGFDKKKYKKNKKNA